MAEAERQTHQDVAIARLEEARRGHATEHEGLNARFNRMDARLDKLLWLLLTTALGVAGTLGLMLLQMR